MRIVKLVVQVLCHATEDEQKVIGAVENLFSSRIQDLFEVSRQRLSGHYGDPIVMYRFETEAKAVASEMLEVLLKRMGPRDRTRVLEAYRASQAKKPRILMQLSKQDGFKGQVRLSRADPIKIEVRVENATLENVTDLLVGGE